MRDVAPAGAAAASARQAATAAISVLFILLPKSSDRFTAVRNACQRRACASAIDNA